MLNNTEALLTRPGKIQIHPAPMPEACGDMLLIRVECVGICGSDIHSFSHGPYIPPSDPNQKIGLGHEFSGTVVSVGPQVTAFQPGDRVVCEPGVPCGSCRFCLSGRYNLCLHMDFMATQPNYRGALTNYLLHPESFTYHLPDQMEMAAGALVEPAAVGMHAAELAQAAPGKKVVILGAGYIGLMTMQACLMRGISQIVLVDLMETRLAMAKRLGASAVVHSGETDPVSAVRDCLHGGADIVFETAGSQTTAQMAAKLVERGGKIMIVGTIPGETPVNFLSINREITIQTVFRYANTFPKTIDAIASRRLDVLSPVTRQYDYAEVQTAFEESLHSKNEIIKSVVHVGPSSPQFQ